MQLRGSALGFSTSKLCRGKKTRNLYSWQRNSIPKPKEVKFELYALVSVTRTFISQHWSIGWIKTWISLSKSWKEDKVSTQRTTLYGV